MKQEEKENFLYIVYVFSILIGLFFLISSMLTPQLKPLKQETNYDIILPAAEK